jgi:hypothetical protein
MTNSQQTAASDWKIGDRFKYPAEQSPYVWVVHQVQKKGLVLGIAPQHHLSPHLHLCEWSWVNKGSRV